MCSSLWSICIKFVSSGSVKASHWMVEYVLSLSTSLLFRWEQLASRAISRGWSSSNNRRPRQYSVDVKHVIAQMHLSIMDMLKIMQNVLIKGVCFWCTLVGTHLWDSRHCPVKGLSIFQLDLITGQHECSLVNRQYSSLHSSKYTTKW